MSNTEAPKPRTATELEREQAARHGLYRKDAERDACGVAFVATLERAPSHAVIEQALTVLENLEHRGGVASDPQTGDGAGVLIQIPHDLLEDECRKLSIPLPTAGTYGLGMLFLPRDVRAQRAAKHLIERVVDEEGQFVLGWREVPVNTDVVGASARATMPSIAQVIIGPGTLTADDHALDRKLYVIRKRIEHESRALDIGEGDYPTSLRSRRAPWSTRACSRPINCRAFTKTSATCEPRPRSRWCTSGSARTPFRVGPARTRTVASRTTERSTRCAATCAGCARESQRCAHPCSARTSASCCPSSTRAARTRPCSTTCSSCSCTLAARCRTR